MLNSDKNKRKPSTRQLLKEILYNSTCQAILKIYESPSLIIKVFWLSCLLGACSLCSYFVIEALTEFFHYQVNLSSRTYFETSSLFPKVTLCNKNLFTTKYAYELANGRPYTDFINYINFNLNDSEREKLAHKFEHVLLDCSFNSEKCSAADFLREYDVSLGNCFTYNSGFNASGHRVSLKYSTRAGSPYGLRLTMYVNVYEKLKASYLGYLGAIVLLGNSSYRSNSISKIIKLINIH